MLVSVLLVVRKCYVAELVVCGEAHEHRGMHASVAASERCELAVGIPLQKVFVFRREPF